MEESERAGDYGETGALWRNSHVVRPLKSDSRDSSGSSVVWLRHCKLLIHHGNSEEQGHGLPVVLSAAVGGGGRPGIITSARKGLHVSQSAGAEPSLVPGDRPIYTVFMKNKINIWVVSVD